MTNPADTGDERAADLRFFGTVTASVTHELNNVNSTIEQIAGLLEDHLALTSTGQPTDPERLRSIFERIVRQTGRAAGTIERLNRFAHYTDEPRARFELNAMIENLSGLAERLAQRHRVELRFVPAADEIMLAGDPFLVARLIFGQLRMVWENLPAGSEIEISAAATERTASVELASPVWTSSGGDDPRPPALIDLAGRLAVSIVDEVVADRRTITLAIPSDPA